MSETEAVGPTTESPPSRTFTWADETATFDCLTITPSGEDHTSIGNETVNLTNIFYINDGVEEYLNKHLDKELEVPQYYNRFDDYSPYISEFSIIYSRLGNGIPQYRLEDAVRAACGKGSYKSDDLSVYGCGNRPFVVQYQGDSFLVELETLQPGEEFTKPEMEVRGFTVTEGSEKIAELLGEAIDLVEEHYPFTFDSYEETTGRKHSFRNSVGETVNISTGFLSSINKLTQNFDEVGGEIEVTVTDSDGEETTFSGVWNSPEHEVGEDIGDGRKEVIIGYKRESQDGRKSSLLHSRVRVYGRCAYMFLKGRTENGGDLRVSELSTRVINEKP